MPNQGEKRVEPGYMPHTLTVSGKVNNPLMLRIEDLRKMDVLEVSKRDLHCRNGMEKETVERYRGVLLRTILDRADIVMKEHCPPEGIYITLSSSNGHGSLFFWHEIYKAPLGEQALVIFEKDGNPLDESEGGIAFITAGDYRPGPRCIRYLQRIEVHELSGNAERS